MRAGKFGRNLSPALIASIAGIRAHRTTACQMVFLAGVSIALLAPVLRLYDPFAVAGTPLRFGSVPSFGYDLGWTSAAMTPDASQLAAVSGLFEALLASAFLTLFVILCSLLLAAGSVAGERASALGVQRAVGASRRILLAAAFGEGGLLAAAALIGGGLAAAWSSRLATGSWPGTLAGEGIGLAPVAGIVACALVLASLLPVLHRGQHRITGAVREPPGLLLPAIQLGLALALLCATAMISHASERMAAAGAGPIAQGMMLSAESPHASMAARAAAYERAIASVGTLPGIDAASMASPGQLVGLGVIDFLKSDCGICPRGGILLPWLELSATIQMVSSDTFRAFGFEVVAGRAFEPGDRIGAEPVAVVNRHVAGRYFEGGRAVGRDLYIGADRARARHRVVGVVEDVRSGAFGGRSQPLETVYLSILQHPPTAAELLLTGDSGPSADVAAMVASRALGTPVRISTPAERFEREAGPGRWFARWFGIEGWAMLAAAVLGIFAFMHRWMVAVAPEIALRRSLGATRRRMALYLGARIAALGLGGTAIGLVFFGPALWSAVAAELPGASAWSPTTVARFAALLVAAAFAGAVLPAWRVLRMPPAAFLAVDS